MRKAMKTLVAILVSAMTTWKTRQGNGVVAMYREVDRDECGSWDHWTPYLVVFVPVERFPYFTAKDVTAYACRTEQAARKMAWLVTTQYPLEIGDCLTLEINQGDRDCEVVAIKRTRFRVEYEMPNAGMMGGWKDGISVMGKMYYDDYTTPSFVRL